VTVTKAPNPLLNETVTFVQHQLPGLDAGEYQLSLSQRVDASDGTPISGDSIAGSYAFAVLGDRFTLGKPAQTIASVFPAESATGEFGNVFPHVVFTQPAFPWSRYPTSAPPAAGENGAVDPDVPTWLAVLLFDEDDAAAYPGLVLAPNTARLGDLFPPQAFAGSTLGSGHSYFDGVTDTSDLDIGTQPTDPVQVLDVPLGLFWQVAPTLADLALLAHVRTVQLTTRSVGDDTTNAGEPTGTYSIVVGNRLPQSGKKQYAYLVSLEELEPFLPTGEDGGPPQGTAYSATSVLRLAVLKSWTFFSTGEPAAFVDQLLALNGRPAGSTADAPDTNLRLTTTSTNGVVAGALTMGYVPLNHELRTAGRTVSWYRGPLVPYAISERRVSIPVSSPDAALAYDPTTGMLDVSYAAAWTIGRMLALQDTSFATALYAWKHAVTSSALASIEDAMLSESYAEILQQGSQPFALVEETAPPASRALLHKLLFSLAQR
jgi:hypothetical protein